MCTVGGEAGLVGDKSTSGPFPAGSVTLSDWAAAVEPVLHLGLPWRMLRPQPASGSADNTLQHKAWLEGLAREQPARGSGENGGRGQIVGQEAPYGELGIRNNQILRTQKER